MSMMFDLTPEMLTDIAAHAASNAMQTLTDRLEIIPDFDERMLALIGAATLIEAKMFSLLDGMHKMGLPVPDPVLRASMREDAAAEFKAHVASRHPEGWAG
jgi:hypothetical protein